MGFKRVLGVPIGIPIGIPTVFALAFLTRVDLNISVTAWTTQIRYHEETPALFFFDVAIAAPD